VRAGRQGGGKDEGPIIDAEVVDEKSLKREKECVEREAVGGSRFDMERLTNQRFNPCRCGCGGRLIQRKTKQSNEKTNYGTDIKTLGDRILVEPVEEKEVKKGGIIIPPIRRKKSRWRALSSPGHRQTDDNGKKIPFEVKKGDRVLVSNMAARKSSSTARNTRSSTRRYPGGAGITLPIRNDQ